MLFRAGDVFRNLFVLRSGVLKSFMVTNDGLMQVTGFHLQGDAVGLDGIGANHHHISTMALDDVEVFVLPYGACTSAPAVPGPLPAALLRTVVHEFVRSQAHLLALGTLRAEQRVVMFLLDLSTRYGHLGYSSSQLVLRMTRHEIGSFLGLELETVSRLLSRLHSRGLIHVDGKAVALTDIPGLWLIADGAPAARPPAVVPLVDREGRPQGAG
jgi:CRP/FNR family transcriptional regulator